MIKELIAGLSLMTITQIAPAKASNAANPDAEKPRLEINNEVVAIVGNSHILLSDVARVTKQVEMQRSQMGSLSGRSPFSEALESLLAQKLLATQARIDSLGKSMPDMSTEIETQIASMVSEIGSVSALEQEYGKPIYAIKEEMLKEYEEVQLGTLMQNEIKYGVKINYPDVKEFFATLPLDSLPLIPEQYVYSQIVRMPPATEQRKFEIRQQLLSFRERILAGERLSTLARLYSKDPGSASRGGEWGPDDVNKLTPQFVEALEGLRPGKISEVFETEYGFHIAELISRNGDIVHCRHMLLKPEFTIEEQNREILLLDSLSAAIGTDPKKFTDAVINYSMDTKTAANQGLVYDILSTTREMNAQLATTMFVKESIFPPQDYIELAKLKVGEVSKPFVSVDTKGNEIYKIIRLDRIVETHQANLELDYEAIADVTLSNKSNIEVDKWIQRTIPKIYVWLNPKYSDVTFDHNWKKQ